MPCLEIPYSHLSTGFCSQWDLFGSTATYIAPYLFDTGTPTTVYSNKTWARRGLLIMVMCALKLGWWFLYITDVFKCRRLWFTKAKYILSYRYAQNYFCPHGQSHWWRTLLNLLPPFPSWLESTWWLPSSPSPKHRYQIVNFLLHA